MCHLFCVQIIHSHLTVCLQARATYHLHLFAVKSNLSGGCLGEKLFDKRIKDRMSKTSQITILHSHTFSLAPGCHCMSRGWHTAHWNLLKRIWVKESESYSTPAGNCWLHVPVCCWTLCQVIPEQRWSAWWGPPQREKGTGWGSVRTDRKIDCILSAAASKRALLSV